MHKGRSPTAFLRNPSRRKAAKHIQSCYVQYHPYFILLCIYIYSNNIILIFLGKFLSCF
jgi:hypothetical protein